VTSRKAEEQVTGDEREGRKEKLGRVVISSF
jgi:hypothetical protein